MDWSTVQQRLGTRAVPRLSCYDAESFDWLLHGRPVILEDANIMQPLADAWSNVADMVDSVGPRTLFRMYEGSPRMHVRHATNLAGYAYKPDSETRDMPLHEFFVRLAKSAELESPPRKLFEAISPDGIEPSL